MITVTTEETMSLEELENIIHELDYEVTSEYGGVIVSDSEADVIMYNKAVK